MNVVVPAPRLLPAALELAKEIVANSPDAVQCTKHGLLLAQKLNHSESFMTHIWSSFSKRVYRGENIKVSQSQILWPPPLPHTLHYRRALGHSQR